MPAQVGGAAADVDRDERVGAMFVENLKRWMNGDALINAVP